MTRKCLAIGVGSVDPVAGSADEFPYLDGAVVAAETIGQWALHSGFAETDVVVLTDKGANKVTDVALQNAFDRLVPVGTTVDHLIVAFAGHGLTGANDDITYWLMSDSLEQGYAVFVEKMRRQLYNFGIRYLTIFSDACRVIATSRQFREPDSRAGVRLRHQPEAIPDVARFNACQDATSAFMIKVPGAAAPGKCLYSGVLAEALWGRVPDAFDGEVIDSGSLGRGLRSAAVARAKQYQLTVKPGGSAFFDKVIYYDRADPPLPPSPDLAPWPSAGDIQVASATIPVEAGTTVATDLFAAVLKSKRARTTVLGAEFGLTHVDLGGGLDAFPGLPESARPVVEQLDETRRQLKAGALTQEHAQVLAGQVSDQVQVLEALAAGEARSRKAVRLRDDLDRTPRFSRRSGSWMFVKAAVRRIWSDQPLAVLDRLPSRTVVTVLHRAPALMMIEFDDGLFAPVWHYPGLVGTVLRDPDGVAAISYGDRYRPSRADDATTEAIARFAAGVLPSAEIDRLATELRHDKHVNPTFGVIAAYCYDILGDVNAIRRMAAYYGQAGQEVPYDVAFMGMIASDGRIAHVPAVPEDRRQREGDVPRWLVERTDAADVPIAGRCPWLRQGWDFLSTPEDADLPLVAGLDRFRAELTSSVFTTFTRGAGEALAERWGLMPFDAR